MKTIGHPNGVDPETWGLVRLLERLVLVARRDAKKGDITAIAFLDTLCPQWRKEASKQNG